MRPFVIKGSNSTAVLRRKQLELDGKPKDKFMQICGSFVATRHNQFIQFIAYDIIVSIIRVTTEVIQ